MSQRWLLVEKGQLKRSKGGRTGGNLNLNSTVTNDWNKKEKLSQLPFLFCFQYIENPKGEKTSLKLILVIKVIIPRH